MTTSLGMSVAVAAILSPRLHARRSGRESSAAGRSATDEVALVAQEGEGREREKREKALTTAACLV